MSVSEFLTNNWYHRNRGPRYFQLAERLNEGVSKGILLPGHPLPAEREIASITGLSRVTVRKAIQILVSKGVIVQKHGSGSFVATPSDRIEQKLSLLTSFSEDMARQGKATSSRWLERGLFLPTPKETLVLNLSPDDYVVRINRLRLADGQPIAIECASLPPDILPNPLDVITSLYEVLDNHGHRPETARQKISAENIALTDAELLEVSENTAVLRVERTSFLKNGRAIEFTQSLYRGDTYNYIAELQFIKN